MKHHKKSAILILIMSSFNLWGHEFLTEMLVYPEDTIAYDPAITYDIIQTIHLDEQALLAGVHKELVKKEIKRIAAKSHRQVNPKFIECDDWDVVFKTCGAFDHFNQARSMAIDICTGLSVSYAELYPDGLIPQFLGPLTFIDGGSAAANHHDDYDFSQGLSFNCVAVISNLATE
ncbi:hypothetical protein ACFODZ_03450 [Marinicella sediminis]|uniref:Uncharacterized protein n=1 Tax=Marinicella sediminis TaxID=1792834 RepID=A0ABV7J545_9GAMM|nr:hypothetical protein [Marinicella sediminis]